MANPYTVLVKPICIGNQVVETVKTYKLLRVTIKEDLKWNLHVDRGEWGGGVSKEICGTVRLPV